VKYQYYLVSVFPVNPPTIIKPLEKETFIKDGQKNVCIKVEVDGMPPPNITWLKNGEPLQQGSNELIIPVFSAANIGQVTNRRYFLFTFGIICLNGFFCHPFSIQWKRQT
jgi:hypothetical protein